MLCQRQVEIDDDSPLAKRARAEGPAFAYLCRACEEQILERHGRRGERPNPLLAGSDPGGRVFF